MPKGKRKNKSGANLHSKLDLRVPTSEEESVVDNRSVISELSELHISDDDTVVEQEDDALILDDFEDKLKEAIDGTFQKNAKVRQNSLEIIRRALCSKYMYDFVVERQVTMGDMAERSLKRGKGEEQAVAAAVAALVCIQLGSAESSEMIFRGIHPLLVVILTDPTALPSVRAQCATSLGLCCFISCSGPEVIQSIMDSLLSVFSASFFKGNGVPPVHKPEICAIHSSAILAWSLLLTLLTPPYIMDLAKSHFKRFSELLESVDLDLRIAAGESIAIFCELARQCSMKNFLFDKRELLCNKLRELATDCQKFRAKKDRRQQRSSFRDILKTVENGEPPDVRIRFGKEILYIESWCQKRQYDAFCQILGSGTNLHLCENELLRDVFELGVPLSCESNPSVRSSKFERHIANSAACKARTKSRNKMRDKRADVYC